MLSGIGLFPVDEVYKVLDKKMQSSAKPIYPVLPSLITAGREVSDFIARGRINFPDEVVFASSLSRVMNMSTVSKSEAKDYSIDIQSIRTIIERSEDGYLQPGSVSALLDAAGIRRVEEKVVSSVDELKEVFEFFNGPLVLKVVGPVHKSDVGGVVLGVDSIDKALYEFDRLMKIDETVGVLVQTMASGTELFAGAKREDKFGHLLMAGLGGIFIEVLKDVNSALVPLSEDEATTMIKSLRGYKLLEGVRGMEGVNIDMFRETIMRLSGLLEAAPEIFEMDLNPLLGSAESVIAVDARIRVEKDKR